jgi:predicted nucleic acid-binding protein
VTARKLTQPVSRDADDDAVLACALAAQAVCDADLLDLRTYGRIPIVSVANAVTFIAGK